MNEPGRVKMTKILFFNFLSVGQFDFLQCKESNEPKNRAIPGKKTKILVLTRPEYTR